MPVVEARVDREKLAELLAEGSESEAVEWKASGDLNDRETLVDLAAEVGAMQMRVEGGYLILGLADDATLTGLSEAEARLLDEAVVRDKLGRYLAGVELLVAVHEVPDDQSEVKRLGLVYVAPTRDGFHAPQNDLEPWGGRHMLRLARLSASSRGRQVRANYLGRNCGDPSVG